MPLTLRGLTAHFHAEHVPEPVLREVWSLRREMIDTGDRSAEEDWDVFQAWSTGLDRCVFAFLDAAGVCQGFFSVAFLPMEVQGHSMLLMYSKYFYFRRAFRGHPLTLLAPWRLIPYVFRRYGMRTLHFVTTAYPQSFVSLARTSGRVYALPDSDVPEHKREALRRFAAQVGGEGFDAERGRIRSATVAVGEMLAQSEDARALLASYERLNPSWREGWVLPILFSVDGRLVRTTTRRVLRRSRRG